MFLNSEWKCSKDMLVLASCYSVALWPPLDVLNILGESHFLRVGLNVGELGGESIQVVVEPAMINYNEM